MSQHEGMVAPYPTGNNSDYPTCFSDFEVAKYIQKHLETDANIVPSTFVKGTIKYSQQQRLVTKNFFSLSYSPMEECLISPLS